MARRIQITSRAQLEQLKQYAQDIRADIRNEAYDHTEDARMASSLFFEHVAPILCDFGDCPDLHESYYEARGARISGYGYTEETGELYLIYMEFEEAGDLVTEPVGNVRNHFRRLEGFLASAMNGLAERMEPSAPAYEMADFISGISREIRKCHLYYVTNRSLKTSVSHEASLEGVGVEAHVWDIQRLFQAVSHTLERKKITVDFSRDFGGGLPCLAMPDTNDTYRTYLIPMPGRILAEVYDQYGPRLLESNVRAFLSLRRKVNKGIRRTIKEEPHMFMAYNNGITATADTISVSEGPGGMRVDSLTNLQIVNGGQTTASLHRALKDLGNADDLLSKIHVQMKLSVIHRKGEYGRIVGRISEYANTQNRVRTSDFSSNHPFHVELEKLSRSTYAPDVDGVMTRWFYERSTGSYHDELQRIPATSRTRRQNFRKENPSRQRLRKTDVGKHFMAWRRLPHIVSLGAEKCFNHFMKLIDDEFSELDGDGEISQHFVPNARFFRNLVAKAILFKRCDLLAYRSTTVQGYKAQTVAYTIAWLSELSMKKGITIDLDAIWERQGLTQRQEKVLIAMLKPVFEHLNSPPKEGQNVSEWSKKESCWHALREKDFDLTPLLNDPEETSHTVREGGTDNAASVDRDYEHLGEDGDSGEAVFVLRTKYGYYVVLGDPDEPIRKARVPVGVQIDLRKALELLAYPRRLGYHPNDTLPVEVHNGRFGLYVQHGKVRASLTPTDDGLEITLDRALELIQSSRPRPLGRHPLLKKTMWVKTGPYGPYVSCGKVRASLPTGMIPGDVTAEIATKLINSKR